MAVEAGVFHALSGMLALLGAILIQIGTNFYNDYADFLKGADTSDRKGPMRATQAGLVKPESMKRATIAVFALAVASGLYLIWRGGLPVLMIGVFSILFGILYTAGRYSLAYLGIADLFVLVFFGPVAVGGTYYVQALAIESVVLVAGFAPGLLAVAILLVNNIRDIDEDRAAGKKTLIVRMGRRFGVVAYCLLCGCGSPDSSRALSANGRTSLGDAGATDPAAGGSHCEGVDADARPPFPQPAPGGHRPAAFTVQPAVFHRMECLKAIGCWLLASSFLANCPSQTP